MKNTYKIKPLEWTGAIQQEYDCIIASTPFGEYRVTKLENTYEWRYCFDEYFDEEDFECISVEEGKRLAEDNWRERIKQCLLEQ